jgi:hypothetical protein
VAAGESPLPAGAAGGRQVRERLFDAVGGEVAPAEIADLGAGERVLRQLTRISLSRHAFENQPWK